MSEDKVYRLTEEFDNAVAMSDMKSIKRIMPELLEVLPDLTEFAGAVLNDLGIFDIFLNNVKAEYKSDDLIIADYLRWRGDEKKKTLHADHRSDEMRVAIFEGPFEYIYMNIHTLNEAMCIIYAIYACLADKLYLVHYFLNRVKSVPSEAIKQMKKLNPKLSDYLDTLVSSDDTNIEEEIRKYLAKHYPEKNN